MRALENLARFVRVKNTEDERQEIREYVFAHAVDLAEGFGVSEAALTAGIASETDDARLARRLLDEVKRATAKTRDLRTLERARAAQASADILGEAARWDGERASIDIVSLLASVLTNKNDLLVFVSDAFTTAIPMGLLYGVAALERVDLAGYVDAQGLHLRWPSGGLNLRPSEDATAAKVVVNLRAPATSLAA